MYLQSCKHDVGKDDSANIKDTNFVPSNEANVIASNVNKSASVLKSVDKSLLKSAKFIGTRQILDSMTIFDKKNMPYFYVFNYFGGGFAIISADRRLLPILAYSNTNYFKHDTFPGVYLDG